jgi:hypothetical protein
MLEFFSFSSWTLSSPALGAIGVRACRLSRPDRSQEKRDPFLICQRTCRALFDLPDDLLFSLFLYPPLSFSHHQHRILDMKETQFEIKWGIVCFSPPLKWAS